LAPVRLRAEFTVYPFVPGEDLPPHVQAAIDASRQAGISTEVGAFGNVMVGEAHAVLDALWAAQEAAIDAGATRIAVNVEIDR
jgi:uncharacterized protein YqgV (UPF0045/DUF77 family)